MADSTIELKTDRDREVWNAAMEFAIAAVSRYAEESAEVHGMGAWWRGAWEAANHLRAHHNARKAGA